MVESLHGPVANRSRERYERSVRGAERGGENEPEQVAKFISENFYGDYLRDRIQAGEHLLVADIGCGHGRNLVFLAQHGCKVIGIDPSPVNRQTAMGHIASAHVESNTEVVAGLSDELPLADGSVDAVVAQGASFLLDGTKESATKYMAEAARVLKTGGVFALVVRSVRDNEAPRIAMPDQGLTAADVYNDIDDMDPNDAQKNRIEPDKEIYRHYFTQEELNEMLAQSGFEIVYQIEQDTDRRARAQKDPVYDQSGEVRKVWTWRTIARKKEKAES